jgi:hypothetical protein
MEGFVELLRDFLGCGGKQVPVAIHSHDNRAVPQVPFDVLGMSALGNQQRSRGMAKLVHSEIVSHVCSPPDG